MTGKEVDGESQHTPLSALTENYENHKRNFGQARWSLSWNLNIVNPD
jgi:hypothetical protein